MKKILTALAMVCLLVFAGNAGAAGKVEILCNSGYAADNHQVKAIIKIAKLVKERTNGEVDIIVEPGGALGFNGYDILRAVKNGELPMSEFVLTGAEGDEKIYGIYGLPFMFKDWNEAFMFHNLSRPYFEKAAAKWNQKFLFYSPWPNTCLWSKRPISSIKDMAGLKTRTFDTNNALMIEKTGGTPYALPFSEVYSSLATNLIDSVLTSTQSGVDGKFWEVVGYLQPIRMGLTVSVLTVSDEVFNKLTAGQRKILTETAREVEKEMWDSIEALDLQNEELCVKNGIKVNPPSPEFKADLDAYGVEIAREWLAKSKSPETVALYNAFQKAVGRPTVDITF